ncbi:sigma-70 family RNA polymerase sigma factor [Parendozoicomonas haliclonae]|uniref:RNA polymerase sigma factor FliA n=1 Tax=Parendozoicomonas haliclonae TaxID=1960125 RepID=A0A1X7ANL7_9GAMM|nr:sigma-70 family RNA polymerase sigma factor [Parendozoicomonas haliclonae]SMA49894.1 RNA polymerase sigma factor FliA [Parendozoicomonas haliclonae]
MVQTEADGKAAMDDFSVWQAYWQQPTREKKNRLLARYNEFANTIALKAWRKAGLPEADREDCQQMATEALLQAIDHYQPGYQARFETYAGKRIYGAVIDGISHYSEQASYYHYQQELKRERRRAVVKEAGNIDRLDDLIAITLELSLVHLLEHEHQRLNYTPAEIGPYSELESARLHDELHGFIGHLTAAEQTVVLHHYQQEKSFADIAREQGISRARVSQLHSSALKKMRVASLPALEESYSL